MTLSYVYKTVGTPYPVMRCHIPEDRNPQHAILFYVPGVYSEPNGTLLCLLLGHSGGITHLQFSPDGTKLLSGGRKDSEIICWDMRNPGTVLFSVQRNVTTNQRMYFDITPDSRHLVSGKWI